MASFFGHRSGMTLPMMPRGLKRKRQGCAIKGRWVSFTVGWHFSASVVWIEKAEGARIMNQKLVVYEYVGFPLAFTKILLGIVVPFLFGMMRRGF